jgi:hypothetical protein
MADGEGDPNLWIDLPWTGRAVMRACCQNEPRGDGAEIVERIMRDLKILIVIQSIEILNYTSTVNPANYFASSV